MVAAATKGLMFSLIQNEWAFGAGLGASNTSITKAKHPPRTASHKPAKKATIHWFLLNTARVRKKKRRDVNVTAVEKKMTTVLPSVRQMRGGIIAGEKKSQIFGYIKYCGKLLAHIQLELA